MSWPAQQVNNPDGLSVLVARDAVADSIFLTIEPTLLGFGQMAIVRSHVFLFSVLEIALTLFQICSLLRTQLTAVDAVRDPSLLITLTPVHLVHAWMTGIDNTRTGTAG